MSELTDPFDKLKAVYNMELSFLRERISHQKETLDFMVEKAIEARGATLRMGPAEAVPYLKAHNSAMIKCYDTYLAESIKRTRNILRKKMGLPTKTS